MTAVKKKEEVVSVVDQMADDATPDEYPDNAPVLIPFRAIRPYSRRAEFKRRLSEFEPLKDKVSEMQASGVFDPKSETVSDVDRINASAAMDDMFQQMYELLQLAAVQPDAYEEWANTLDDDNDLVRVFNVYMNRSQPGEASGSTS